MLIELESVALTEQPAHALPNPPVVAEKRIARNAQYSAEGALCLVLL